MRTAVLQERELDYLAAARLRDESALHVMFVEILPNVLGPIIVEFTVRLGYAIFTIATLSFLGFGVQLPTPDWGADIANNYQYLARRATGGRRSSRRSPSPRSSSPSTSSVTRSSRCSSSDRCHHLGPDRRPSRRPPPTLEVSHLDVTYRVRGNDRLALRDVSFQIGRQESFGLVGESGCGKSTTALADHALPPSQRAPERRVDHRERPGPRLA